MNNNQKLIDAVNCKFPQNNLIELPVGGINLS